jgi:hypothetical protein
MTLTRLVMLVSRSRRYTSLASLVSVGTRSGATDSKTRYRPSALMSGREDRRLPAFHRW